MERIIDLEGRRGVIRTDVFALCTNYYLSSNCHICYNKSMIKQHHNRLKNTIWEYQVDDIKTIGDNNENSN